MSDFIVGLDLGQSQDPTALAAIERLWRVDSEPDLHIRHLERFQLGTPYPAIVASVLAMLATSELKGAALLVDATGVGAAVVDLFRAADLPLIAVSVHGGDTASGSDTAGYRVPKRDLVGSAQVALQQQRLKIAAALPEAATLVKELLAYRVTISATGHDSYAAWREQDHDDLVFAVALACWYAERPQPRPFTAVVGGTRPIFAGDPAQRMPPWRPYP